MREDYDYFEYITFEEKKDGDDFVIKGYKRDYDLKSSKQKSEDA